MHFSPRRMFVSIATAWFLVSLAVYLGGSWVGFYTLWHTLPSLPDLVFKAVLWGSYVPGLPLGPFVASLITWPGSAPGDMAGSMAIDVAQMAVGLAVNSLFWAALLTCVAVVLRRRRHSINRHEPPPPALSSA